MRLSRARSTGCCRPLVRPAAHIQPSANNPHWSPAAEVSFAWIFRHWVVRERRPQPSENSNARRASADWLLSIGGVAFEGEAGLWGGLRCGLQAAAAGFFAGGEDLHSVVGGHRPDGDGRRLRAGAVVLLCPSGRGWRKTGGEGARWWRGRSCREQWEAAG